MVFFGEKFLIFIAIFVVKIDKNCYDVFAFWWFLVFMAWKTSYAVHCSV